MRGPQPIESLVTWGYKSEIKGVVLNAGAAVLLAGLAIVWGMDLLRTRPGCGELEPGDLTKVPTCIYGTRPHIGRVTADVPAHPGLAVTAFVIAGLLLIFAVFYAVVTLWPGGPTPQEWDEFQRRVAAARAPLYARWQQWPSPETASRLQQFDAEVARVTAQALPASQGVRAQT